MERLLVGQAETIVLARLRVKGAGRSLVETETQATDVAATVVPVQSCRDDPTRGGSPPECSRGVLAHFRHAAGLADETNAAVQPRES